MILMGILGKIGAIFSTIPTPVIGGMFLVAFGVIGAAGISNLQVNKLQHEMEFIFKQFIFTIENCAKTSHFEVHRHEFLEEYIHFRVVHVFCTGHSKLDPEES